jgi:transcriptional regulator with PAS, ATPase and Fis domain
MDAKSSQTNFSIPPEVETLKVLVIGAVIDINPDAEAIPLAKEMGITTGQDYRDFIRDETLDIIVNMTGNPELQQELSVEKLPQTVLIGKKSAMLIWTTMDDEKRSLLLKQFLHPSGGELSGHTSSGFVVGNTERMKEIINMIAQVAPTPTTVLIRGESGTGKELVARMIHNRSPWRAKALVTVNCTTFSASLIESELFGYKKEAFTGAVSDHTGLLELASNGTLFLDEIGDMPYEMQGKLLRFLQSGEIRPIGDFKTKKVRVRIIAATNRNLEEAIKVGKFRSDLFYRLNAFTILTLPLRERLADIPFLSYHFLAMANQKVKRNISNITPAALSALSVYDWPGNIRELKNIIERAVVLATDSEIAIKHLPNSFQPDEDVEVSGKAALNEGLMALKASMINKFEYEAVCKYLSAHNGNVSRAAVAAKVPRRTFQRLMSKHNISSTIFRGNNGVYPEE